MIDAIDQVMEAARAAKIYDAEAWAAAAEKRDEAIRVFDAARAAMEKVAGEAEICASKLRSYVTSERRSFLCRTPHGFVLVRWQGSTDNTVELLHDFAEEETP